MLSASNIGRKLSYSFGASSLAIKKKKKKKLSSDKKKLNKWISNDLTIYPCGMQLVANPFPYVMEALLGMPAHSQNTVMFKRV